MTGTHNPDHVPGHTPRLEQEARHDALKHRGAALALEAPFLMAAAFTLTGALVFQSIVSCTWLTLFRPGLLIRVIHAWRASMFAGIAGAAASAGWITAIAIEPVAHVRTLALIELVFSYTISRRIFKEQFGRLQIVGIGVLVLALVIVTLGSR